MSSLVNGIVVKYLDLPILVPQLTVFKKGAFIITMFSLKRHETSYSVMKNLN